MTTGQGDADEDPSGPFDIYETADGPRHVGNPVRRSILIKMRGAELTIPEMIRVTGLTKSTISAHLAHLYREHLVAYREDPDDRRRKFYYLTGRHVGTARRCTERLPFRSPTDDGKGPHDVSRLLLRALLAELTCCGLDLEPVVRETGRRVGELAGRGQDPRDFQEFCATAARFWTESGLGTLECTSLDPPAVAVKACGLCFPGADARMSLCAVTAGILEGMASEAFRTSVDVRRIRPEPADGGPPALAAGPTDGPTAGPTGSPLTGDDAVAEGTGCGCTFEVLFAEPGSASVSGAPSADPPASAASSAAPSATTAAPPSAPTSRSSTGVAPQTEDR